MLYLKTILNDKYNELFICCDNIEEELKYMEDGCDDLDVLEEDEEYIRLIEQRDQLIAEMSNLEENM